MYKLVLFSLIISTLSAHPLADYMEKFAADWVRLSPTTATSSQYFSGEEQDRLDGQLTLPTPAYRAARVALAEAKYADYQLPLNQFNGPQRSTVTWLANSHPVHSLRDAENYVSRVSQFGERIDIAADDMRHAASRGFYLPDFILTATIKQMERFVGVAPTDNLLATSLARRLAGVAGIDASMRERLVAQVEGHLRDTVYPAYARAIDLLRSHLQFATSDAGLWRLEGGAEAYAERLRHYTNGNMTAQEIHELGLSEVARIETEMDEILRSYGLVEGSINSRYAELERRIQPAEADPRPRLLREYEEMVVDAAERARPLFDVLPRSALEVRREPLFSEANAAAHYSSPAPDGSRPGVFWVPLPGAPWRMISRRSLAYHEAIPGHHFQLALQVEMEGLPKWWASRVFGGNSAYSEGWGLYAEWLANDEGWFEGDSIGKLGFLSSELLRAKRLVVDTGIHAFKWTRQDVIDYGISVSETERYVVYPGQACSYKVGQLRLVALRRDAEKRLGAKFSLPAFHNIVLRGAGAPLDLVGEEVETWINTTLAN